MLDQTSLRERVLALMEDERVRTATDITTALKADLDQVMDVIVILLLERALFRAETNRISIYCANQDNLFGRVDKTYHYIAPFQEFIPLLKHWVSVADLMQKTLLKETTIRRRLDRMEEAGVIKRSKSKPAHWILVK